MIPRVMIVPTMIVPPWVIDSDSTTIVLYNSVSASFRFFISMRKSEIKNGI